MRFFISMPYIHHFRILTIVFCIGFSWLYAEASDESSSEEGGEFNTSEMIMHHIQDTHDFHILDWDGHAVSIPLPIILWTNEGLVTFMSSEFHHTDDGSVVVEKGGQGFIKYHEKIYYAGDGLMMDETDHPTNAKPLDFSVTKNVFTLFLSVIFLLWLFIKMARTYGTERHAPRGVAKFLEPIVVYFRDEVIIPNIGSKHAARFTPYLLTLFFFIWTNNMIGLIPFFPFGANLSGNIAFTGVLALITLILTLFNSGKSYWGHIFMPPGAPAWLLPLFIPIEIIGIITKPFALMIRLFANITAGHVIILSIVSIIFIYKSLFVAAPLSVIFMLFLNSIELLVALIQAFLFVLLSSVFIGQAVASDDHH